MSDSVKCERCGAEGRRRLGRVAPEGWFYAEFRCETSGTILFAYACSKECTAVEWREGPGDLKPIEIGARYLYVLTQDEGRRHEHTIRVHEGDRVQFGRSEVRVGPGYVLVPGGAVA